MIQRKINIIWSRALDKIGYHVHIRSKVLNIFFQNQTFNDPGLWYIPLWMWDLQCVYDYWSLVDLDLLYDKGKCVSECIYMGKTLNR